MPVNGTRVTLYLPVNTISEKLAVDRVLSKIHQDYGGSTSSLLEPPVFIGHWEDGDTVIEDKVTFVSFDVINQTAAELTPNLEGLKVFVSDAYEHFGSRQLEIWLTAEDLSIFVD